MLGALLGGSRPVEQPERVDGEVEEVPQRQAVGAGGLPVEDRELAGRGPDRVPGAEVVVLEHRGQLGQPGEEARGRVPARQDFPLQPGELVAERAAGPPSALRRPRPRPRRRRTPAAREPVTREERREPFADGRALDGRVAPLDLEPPEEARSVPERDAAGCLDEREAGLVLRERLVVPAHASRLDHPSGVRAPGRTRGRPRASGRRPDRASGTSPHRRALRSAPRPRASPAGRARAGRELATGAGRGRSAPAPRALGFRACFATVSAGRQVASA